MAYVILAVVCLLSMTFTEPSLRKNPLVWLIWLFLLMILKQMWGAV